MTPNKAYPKQMDTIWWVEKMEVPKKLYGKDQEMQNKLFFVASINGQSARYLTEQRWQEEPSRTKLG